MDVTSQGQGTLGGNDGNRGEEGSTWSNFHSIYLAMAIILRDLQVLGGVHPQVVVRGAPALTQVIGELIGHGHCQHSCCHHCKAGGEVEQHPP